MISCAVMKMRTAALNRSTPKSPSAVLNFIKLSDARLQAVLSRKRYSEQGLVEFCRSVPLRSEEHTSELQSPYDLVCRLLLEKKKKKKKKNIKHIMNEIKRTLIAYIVTHH